MSEFDKLFEWWRQDAAFKAPEMLDAWYATECMGQLAEHYEEARPRRLEEGEYRRVFEILNSGDKDAMRTFLRGEVSS